MEPGAAPHADGHLHQRAKGLWITKLSLRGASLVFCLPLIGATAALLDLHYMSSVCLLPQACLVLLWDAAEMITLVARRRPAYKGIRPGACVGVDLVLWLGLTVGVGLTAPGIGPYTPELFTVSAAFAILVTLVQIALFIIACVETHRLNSSKSAQHNATWPAATQGTPQTMPGTAQPARCPTCPPGMSCPKCTPSGYPTPSTGAGYPPPAAGWQYKPELPAQNSPYPGAPPAQHEMPAQNAPYPGAHPAQHEMSASPPAPHEMPTSPPAGPQVYEMWTGNAPRHEMPAQSAGHAGRKELPPQ